MKNYKEVLKKISRETNDVHAKNLADSALDERVNVRNFSFRPVTEKEMKGGAMNDEMYLVAELENGEMVEQRSFMTNQGLCIYFKNTGKENKS